MALILLKTLGKVKKITSFVTKNTEIKLNKRLGDHKIKILFWMGCNLEIAFKILGICVMVYLTSINNSMGPNHILAISVTYKPLTLSCIIEHTLTICYIIRCRAIKMSNTSSIQILTFYSTQLHILSKMISWCGIHLKLPTSCLAL